MTAGNGDVPPNEIKSKTNINEEAKQELYAIAREARQELDSLGGATTGLYDYTGIQSNKRRKAKAKSKFKSTYFTPRYLGAQERQRVMQDFKDLRSTFVVDTVYLSLLGFSLAWAFFSFQDALSYALGLSFGLMYALLLGRYVEKLGDSPSAGSARFAPVILMVLLYGKNMESLRLVPELVGFMTYQLASFVQAFNTDEVYSSPQFKE